MSIGSSLLRLAAEWECFHSQENCRQPQTVKTSRDVNYVLQRLQKSRKVDAGGNAVPTVAFRLLAASLMMFGGSKGLKELRYRCANSAPSGQQEVLQGIT